MQLSISWLLRLESSCCLLAAQPPAGLPPTEHLQYVG